jgi:ubiquinone/menaquinone biosynthesis C-methylase UbiE
VRKRYYNEALIDELRDHCLVQTKTEAILDTARGYGATLDRLQRFFPPSPTAVALDLGCGSGELTLPLSNIHDSIISLDLEKTSISLGKKIAYLMRKSRKVCFVVGNGEDLPFNKSIFDIVYAFASLEHMRDSSKVLSELNRVLRNDGRIVAYVPHRSTRYAKLLNKLTFRRACHAYLAEHVSAHDPDTWIRMLKENGFAVRKLVGQSLVPPLHWFLPIMGDKIYYALTSMVKGIDWKLCEKPSLAKNHAIAIFIIAEKIRSTRSGKD